MSPASIKPLLEESFNDLSPFGDRYKSEKKRYLHTLSRIGELPLNKIKRILDIGTGVGVLPLTLKKMGLEAEGLDFFIFPENKEGQYATGSFKQIDSLKKRWSELNLIIHEKNILEDNLEPLGTFDLVINEATIEHLKDPKTFLQKCHSLLTAGGYLIISTPNQTKLLNRLRFLFGKSIYWPVNEFFADGEKFVGHWREYTLKELEFMAVSAGFKIVLTENINLLSQYRKLKSFRKLLRAFVSALSALIPSSHDMNYVIAEKK